MRNCDKCGHELPVTTSKTDENICFKTEGGAAFMVDREPDNTLSFRFGTQIAYKLGPEQVTALFEWMKLLPFRPKVVTSNRRPGGDSGGNV